MTDDPKMREAEHWKKSMTLAHLVGAGLDVSEPVDLPVCPLCDRERNDVRRRRINAAYVEEERNWITCCADCFEDTREHYAEMWDAYYHDCM